jgi:lipopolysaccharide transport system permease protein
MVANPFVRSPKMEWKRYRDIIVYRAYAELKSEAQLNYMGYVWWLLEPLLNTILFYIILVAVLEGSAVGTIPFLLVGAITWQWLNATIMTAAGTIFDAGGMLKQIYLPKAVLPLIAVLTCTFKFLFIFALLLVFTWVTGHFPTVTYAALPLLLLLELAVIIVLSLPLAAVMPFFPDARVAIDAVLRSVMLVSGTLFPVSKIPGPYHALFYLNPMAILIEAFRAVLLDGKWPRWDLLSYVAGFCLVAFTFTWWLYARVDRSIVKSIHR